MGHVWYGLEGSGHRFYEGAGDLLIGGIGTMRRGTELWKKLTRGNQMRLIETRETLFDFL
ncbi:MAG: hypothetical protein CMM01_01705 [Rhodopirellula sp.]|nr:hypothetical protein [Rhodopirellula sp.]